MSCDRCRTTSRAGGFGDAIDEQRELVAGEAAEHGLRGQHAGQPFGEHFEHAVARGMAEGVVHFLEVVHVQIKQRDAGARAQRARNGLLQQMLELHAVRDLGERVIARQVTDAPLGALAVGDVARHIDMAGELRFGSLDGRTG